MILQQEQEQDDFIFCKNDDNNYGFKSRVATDEEDKELSISGK